MKLCYLVHWVTHTISVFSVHLLQHLDPSSHYLHFAASPSDQTLLLVCNLCSWEQGLKVDVQQLADDWQILMGSHYGWSLG
jgi:hypothetical protein